jgi:hypothetical protein
LDFLLTFTITSTSTVTFTFTFTSDSAFTLAYNMSWQVVYNPQPPSFLSSTSTHNLILLNNTADTLTRHYFHNYADYGHLSKV